MKKAIVFFVLGALVLLLFPAREIQLSHPLASDADRVLSLSESFVIDGESSDNYFLKYTRLPKWSFDGELLLISDQDQLLAFNSRGDFRGNHHKRGEGPGEWGNTIDICHNSSSWVIASYNPLKILLFDQDLVYQGEIRLKKGSAMLSLLKGSLQGGLFFDQDFNFSEARTGMSGFNHVLHSFEPGGQTSPAELAFKQPAYIISQQREGVPYKEVFWDMQAPFVFAVDSAGENMLLCCNDRYRLELVDLQSNKVKATLERSFERTVWQSDLKRPRRIAGIPKKDYFNDILAVLSSDSDYWVFTSRVDEKKGILVDLISFTGNYSDRFWLPLPGIERAAHRELQKQLAVSRDHIAWIHQDEDENPIVTVYSYSLR